MIQAHPLQVCDVRPQGSDAVQLVLQPAPEAVQTFDFAPGQYITVKSGPPERQEWRCYSINTQPAPDGQFAILVRQVPGGLVSGWINSQVGKGDQLLSLPPAGRFTLRKNPAGTIRLFAAGSGISPILALAGQALEQGAPKVELFYANRNRETSMLDAELDTLAQAWPERFSLVRWYDNESGLPDAAALIGTLPSAKDTHVYTCGPAPFMAIVTQAVSSAGVPPEQIFLEAFELNDADENLEPPAADAPQTAHLQASVGGKTYTLELAGSETLLAAMIKAGLPVPHSCRVGECASCMCRLESGDVERLENDVLDEDDEEEGWILACRSRPLSDAIKIAFP